VKEIVTTTESALNLDNVCKYGTDKILYENYITSFIKIVTAVVIKLGTTTLLRVTKVLKRVANYLN
jgi:hypothetical protein